MAAVIHSLWEKGDKNPIILPSTIPIDDSRVQTELTRYLSDNWAPIIEKDVDGPNSLPLKIDAEKPNLGKLHATRRVARTIYLGSAPTSGSANRGIEDRLVKLGCVLPGESAAVFGDALRHLAASATYLYQDGPRVWYATQPTVTKVAEDRAEQLKRNPDAVAAELDARVRADLRKTGDFDRIHPLPRSGADVPDDMETRLVVMSADHPYSKDSGNAAELAAKAILETRGNTPRLYRNALVYLAADKVRLQDLDEALRKYLAWSSIVAEKDTLNLDPHQVKQAETQCKAADGMVLARLPETYQWLLVPEQKTPQAPVSWIASRLSGNDALAARVSKKLRSEELLLKGMASTILRKHLDDVPLWNGDHVSVKQLAEHFSRYLYLPRLAGPEVLVSAVRDGMGLITWQKDSFATAEAYDDSSSRYRGLRAGTLVSIEHDSAVLLVKPDAAQRQLDAEGPQKHTSGENQASANTSATTDTVTGGAVPRGTGVAGKVDPQPLAPVTKRYHGSVDLDSVRVGVAASQVASEVISHLAGLIGAKVRVTLEIEADVPGGVPEHVVRTVSENSRTLKFTSHGFEKE
jgi:hypothetical protein